MIHLHQKIANFFLYFYDLFQIFNTHLLILCLHFILNFLFDLTYINGGQKIEIEMYANQFWWAWPLQLRRFGSFCLPSKTAKISFWTKACCNTHDQLHNTHLTHIMHSSPSKSHRVIARFTGRSFTRWSAVGRRGSNWCWSYLTSSNLNYKK